MENICIESVNISSLLCCIKNTVSGNDIPPIKEPKLTYFVINKTKTKIKTAINEAKGLIPITAPKLLQHLYLL